MLVNDGRCHAHSSLAVPGDARGGRLGKASSSPIPAVSRRRRRGSASPSWCCASRRRGGKASGSVPPCSPVSTASRAVEAAQYVSSAAGADPRRRGALPVRRPGTSANGSRLSLDDPAVARPARPSTKSTSPRAWPRWSGDRYSCCTPCSSISTTPCSHKPTTSRGPGARWAVRGIEWGIPHEAFAARAEVDHGGGKR